VIVDYLLVGLALVVGIPWVLLLLWALLAAPYYALMVILNKD